MSTVSPINGLPAPDDGSPNDPPIHFQALIDSIDGLLNARFPSAAARDAAISAPVNGMRCWTDDGGFMVYNNGWKSTRDFGASRATNLANPVSAQDAATKAYVDDAANGSTGTLPLIGGWGVFSGYHTPAWYLAPSGIVTLSGMVLRTAASFALGSGSGFQFATLPTQIIPVTTVSPACYVGVGPGPSNYPARLFCNHDNNLQVAGMDAGSGTMTQNVGYINLDGVSWHI